MNYTWGHTYPPHICSHNRFQPTYGAVGLNEETAPHHKIQAGRIQSLVGNKTQTQTLPLQFCLDLVCTFFLAVIECHIKSFLPRMENCYDK